MEKIPHVSSYVAEYLMKALSSHGRLWCQLSIDPVVTRMFELKLIERVWFYVPQWDHKRHSEIWLTAWGRKVAFEIWKAKGCPK